MTSFSNSGLNKTNITKNTLLWGQILEKAYTESFLNTQLYIALLETNPDCICSSTLWYDEFSKFAFTNLWHER